MTRHLAALAVLAALTLSACGDPTKKHDYACTGTSFGSESGACVQFHITEVEGNAAQVACEDDKHGTWTYHPCDTAGAVPGYCQVDSAKDYSLSATPAKVFFYGLPNEAAASAACTAGEGTWVSGG